MHRIISPTQKPWQNEFPQFHMVRWVQFTRVSKTPILAGSRDLCLHGELFIYIFHSLSLS